MSRTFSPTIRSSMWSTIPTPWRAPAGRGALEQLDQPEPLAVQRHRHAALELDGHDLGLVGGLLGPRDELEDVVLGRVVELLDPAPLARAPPQVVVDRVRRDLGPALDGDPVLARVRDLLLAPHPPLAHRRDHLQLGPERRDRRLDPHLVVALAGAAVRDRVAAGRRRAYSTASLAISGRPSAVNSG